MALNGKVPQGPLSKKWTDYRSKMNLVAPNNKRKLEIIVVGTGLAGASAAKNRIYLLLYLSAGSVH